MTRALYLRFAGRQAHIHKLLTSACGVLVASAHSRSTCFDARLFFR